MKKYPTITINIPGQRKPIITRCEEEESLLEAITKCGLRYPADCGGRGTCGKCKVQLQKGELEITTQDKNHYSKEELHQGIRLSCKAHPRMDVSILLIAGEEAEFDTVTNICTEHAETKTSCAQVEDDSYYIAIDLGTTTLALSLFGVGSQRVVKTHTRVNRQRSYGSDVVSRIKASNEGKRDLLKDLIREELYEGINALIIDAGISLKQISRIAIAGNTTMGHLLMGYPCETLGVSPFHPYRIDEIEVAFGELFSEQIIVPVVLLPGISTFVGGDIVAGLYYCGFHEAEKPCLLIDIGTNGEMAIGNKNELLVTSTAAGPAFEGGNITCGVGSVPGAISQVTLTGESVSYQTIGGKPPIGICGTGVVEIVSELYQTGRMDDTGLLMEPYFEQGFPIADLYFTQKDVREFQLAKAAIRAGIETLVRRYGITYAQLDKVYLAGGFGFRMDISKAILIGLLPEELKDKIEVVGNSSLAGAMQYLVATDAKKSVDKICSVAKEIHLSNDQDFYDKYIAYMSF